MAGKTVRDHGREVRETIVKSSLAGVGVTVLAVTLCSQTGLAGMIGTSAASSMGGQNASNDPYAKLPPFPTLLTHTEITDIRGQLASVAAAMEITRAATDDRIEFVHELAERPGALSIGPPRHFAKSMPVAVVPAAPAATPAVATIAPISDVAVASDGLRGTESSAVDAATPTVAYVPSQALPCSSHLELAALFFGGED